MTTETISQTVLFPNLFDKPLHARFDQPHTNSDRGAVLLKAAEKLYGLVAGFVRCLVDRREPGKVRHTVADLLSQRVIGIACGNPDGNDAEHLADDPIHKLLLGRDPATGEPLASQRTNEKAAEVRRTDRPVPQGAVVMRNGDGHPDYPPQLVKTRKKPAWLNVTPACNR